MILEKHVTNQRVTHIYTMLMRQDIHSNQSRREDDTLGIRTTSIRQFNAPTSLFEM